MARHWPKVVPLVVLFILFYYASDTFRRKVDVVKSVVPYIMTYTEMMRYTGRLENHMSKNRQPPADLRGWICENFGTGTGRDPSVDHFGTPYTSSWHDQVYYLRSCGRDGRARTHDDITMAVAIHEE